jgi:hypothetical protein
MKRRIVALLAFTILLVSAMASRADAGARRTCIDAGWSSNPMTLCLPIIFAD